MRLRRGFTVDGLAEAMGSHRSTNYRHDAGLFAPNTDHLRAAAGYRQLALGFQATNSMLPVILLVNLPK